MKQKLMLIALSVMLIFSMAACSSAEPAVAEAPEAAAESSADTDVKSEANAETNTQRIEGPQTRW